MAEPYRYKAVSVGGAVAIIPIRDGKNAAALSRYEAMEAQQDIVVRKVELLNGTLISGIVDDSMDLRIFSGFEELLTYLNEEFIALHPEIKSRWNLSNYPPVQDASAPAYSRSTQYISFDNKDAFETVKIYFDERVWGSAFGEQFG